MALPRRDFCEPYLLHQTDKLWVSKLETTTFIVSIHQVNTARLDKGFQWKLEWFTSYHVAWLTWNPLWAFFWTPRNCWLIKWATFHLTDKLDTSEKMTTFTSNFSSLVFKYNAYIWLSCVKYVIRSIVAIHTQFQSTTGHLDNWPYSALYPKKPQIHYIAPYVYLLILLLHINTCVHLHTSNTWICAK